eukprot:1269123-Amphidinium_carterae.2
MAGCSVQFVAAAFGLETVAARARGRDTVGLFLELSKCYERFNRRALHALADIIGVGPEFARCANFYSSARALGWRGLASILIAR